MESPRRNLVNPSFLHVMIKEMMLLLLCSGVNSTPDVSPDCDFQNSDMCGWKSDAEWQWLRYIAADLAGKPGPSADHFEEAEGYFMYASASDSEFSEAVLISPFIDGSAQIRRCFTFYFMKEDEGGITDLQVIISTEDGEEKVVWRWEDGTKVQEWQKGQVELNQEEMKNQFKIKVIARHGETDSGFVAVDDFYFQEGENCLLETSTEASPTITTSPSTEASPTIPTLPSSPSEASPTITTSTSSPYMCDFQEENMCGWESEGKWYRVVAADLEEEHQPGPQADHYNVAEGYFMYASADDTEDSEAVLFSPFFNGSAQIRRCFMFYFMKEDEGGITDLEVIIEAEDGEEKLVWKWEDGTKVQEWQKGQVELNQEETQKQYKIKVIARRGAPYIGFVAVDDFELYTLPVGENCVLEPTTEAPPTTSISGVDDCDFEKGACGWTEAGGSEEFRWRVTTPKEEAEAGHQTPATDPNGDENGHVMYVTAASGTAGQTTRIQTAMEDEPVNKCFMFEYNIDRFGGISTLRILTKEPDSAEEVVWELTKDTSTLPEGGAWPEPGQVPINARQIIVEAVLGDKDAGYVAMDDFLFWAVEECPIRPDKAAPGGQTTTSAQGSSYFLLESQLQEGYVLQSVAHNETPIMMYMSEENMELQLWKFDGEVLVAKSNGQALDIDGSTSGHKAHVLMWDMHGWSNQQFKFQDNEILSVRDGTALDVQSGNVEDGTQVWMYDRNGTPAQKWNQVFIEATTTSSPGTTTSAGGFPACDFEVDTCGWIIEHDSDFSWIRTTPQEQIDAGHNCINTDPNGDANGHVMYMQSYPGKAGDMARIQTPMNEMNTKTCMMFEYSMDHVDGIRALRIRTQEEDGWEEVVWDLTSSLERNAEWPEPGQVPLETHQVIIEAVRGDSEEGFAALDDIFFFDAPDCPVLPPEAKPHPTETPPVPTTTRKPGLQDCHFETPDLCGWSIDEELNNTNTFTFRRVTGQQLEGQNGPQTDHLDNATSYFLYADAALGKPETQTVLSSPMVPYSPETNICFHFWFSMPKKEGIRTLKVLIELPGGDQTLLWEYQSKLSFWNHAQMEINQGADEFKIVIIGVRGEVNEGYIALDEFEIKTEYFECFHEPEDSDPRTTTPIFPTDSTTSSPDSGWFLLESFLEEGLVLQSVPHGSTPVVMYRSDEDLQLQLWRFDGQQVVSKNNGMVLDISGGEVGSTATVVMWDKHGEANQQFKFQDNELVSVRDNTALDVKGANKEPGTQVQMYERNGTPAQKWRQIVHDKLASCDFETDFCGWTKEEGLNSSQGFEFTRQTGQDFIGEFTEGPKTDHNNNNKAYFLYANVSYGEPETETAITSPVISAGIFCFKFWFDMKHFGGIRAMNVFLKLPDGLLIPVWEYQNHVETWTAAQVQVDWFAEPFQLVITGVRGGSMQGYIAMDDFNAVYSNEECNIQPPDAEPHITTPRPTNQASTTTHHPKDIGCSFDYDMCGYQITGDNGFEFSRKNGENFQNDPQHGPAMDENESTTAYFVHVSASQVQAPVKDDLAVSEIQIPMIRAMDHMIECFHFWFAMKRDGTIRTIAVVQQDEDGEDNAGAVKIIWNYHSSQVDNEKWLEGQVEVRADSVADVYQNYTLRIVAERNGISEDWAALDSFTFTRSSECMVKPSGAEPASTTPLPSPTPHDPDLNCDFDTDMCGFKTETGQADFVFERVQGKNISSIDYDHNYNIDGYFLYAHDDSGIRDYTWLRSDEFDGQYHPLECFHFWFYVEGFKATNRNFLNITVTYEEAQLPDDFVWSFPSSTEGWTEGQVEIRAKEIDDVPKDFRIFIVADKPNDLVAFVAVDDFVMTRNDICEYFPPLSPDTTTTSGTTTLPNCDDAFSCDEFHTQCIPMTKVCDFNTDCENGMDERECPNIYLFDDCEAENPLDNCGWEDRSTDNLEWDIVAKNETDATNHPIDRGGKFFWIKKIKEEGNNVAYVHSPMYQQSDIQCIFSFYYYIAGDLGNSPIIPALHVFEGDRQINLDYLSINDKWTRYEISLGRRISPFEVVFMRENSSVFDAGVAFDDVGFDSCGLPRPQETCDGLASFQCANKACISPDRLCDLSDDCGDKSDEEGLYCDTHTYWQSTFEDDNKPFGMFSPDPDPESFRWKRGSGETANRGTGPPFDHTTFDVEGHYLYIDSSYDQGPQNAFAEIVSEIFVPDPANELECRMIFYYHMTGPFVGALWVSIRYENGRNVPLWEKSGNLGNKWNREVLTINSTVVKEDYSVVFKATIGKQYQGDIAIDDVTFSPACRPKNAPSTTTSTPTPTPDGCPGGFQCNNGNCILNTQVCDFHYDCEDGLEDEAGCPTEYSFEDCSTIEQCGLEQVIPDNLDFVITTGEAIAASEHRGRGPNADYENSTTTHFLYAMPKGADCCSQDVADIQTHQFQNADARCLMNFWAYISSGNPNFRVYPYLFHTELEFITRLDRLDTDSLGDAMWTKVQIGIGRHRDPFKLGFSLIQDDGDTKYDTGLAIDEMFMFDCDRLMPNPDGCPENEWQCKISKACIAHTQLCDYSDDCGDGSDEVMFDEICVDFTRTDFENPDQPFGFFNQDDERPEFRWKVGNGSISTEGTGPPFDHTFFSPVGHYLYIASDEHDKDERAWITSPTIDVSTKDCMVRFWYHMHGQGVGNLTIYRQNMKGALEQLWRASGQDGIDENRWRRNLQILQSQEQFKIVIEASVGEKNKGNIAIDDVSFTPACSFVDNPTTTSTATPGTTTTPRKPPTTHTTTWKPPTTHTTPWEPPTTHWSSTTELIVTPSPSDPHQGSVIIICAVVGAVVVIGLVLIIVVTVYKRGVPSMDSVRSFLNPSYERFGGTSSGDTHMMSLRELTSKEEQQ